jgi:hypothetical protein
MTKTKKPDQQARACTYVQIDRASIIRARGEAGSEGVALLVALSLYQSRSGGAVSASFNNLAHASGLRPRTVARIIMFFESAGIIARQDSRPTDALSVQEFVFLPVALLPHEGGDWPSDQ